MEAPALSKSQLQQILETPQDLVLGNMFNVDIYYKTLHRVADNRFLDAESIYVTLCHISKDKHVKIIDPATFHSLKPSHVSKMLKRNVLLEENQPQPCLIIPFPIKEFNHWVLGIVYFNRDIIEFLYLDPLYNSASTCPYMSNLLVPIIENLTNRKVQVRFQETLQKQDPEDSVNCGVFICYYVQIILDGYSAENVPSLVVNDYRQQILNILLSYQNNKTIKEGSDRKTAHVDANVEKSNYDTAVNVAPDDLEIIMENELSQYLLPVDDFKDSIADLVVDIFNETDMHDLICQSLVRDIEETNISAEYFNASLPKEEPLNCLRPLVEVTKAPRIDQKGDTHQSNCNGNIFDRSVVTNKNVCDFKVDPVFSSGTLPDILMKLENQGFDPWKSITDLILEHPNHVLHWFNSDFVFGKKNFKKVLNLFSSLNPRMANKILFKSKHGCCNKPKKKDQPARKRQQRKWRLKLGSYTRTNVMNVCTCCEE